MKRARCRDRLTAITSDFERMSLAARCQCWRACRCFPLAVMYSTASRMVQSAAVFKMAETRSRRRAVCHLLPIRVGAHHDVAALLLRASFQPMDVSAIETHVK
jgi:hypothetical protein